MLVLVHLLQPRAILLMLLVLLPVLLRAMCRPTTIRTLKVDSLRLSLGMRMRAVMVTGTHGTWREGLYGLAARTDGGERGLREQVKEVVLGQNRLLRLRLCCTTWKSLFEP